MKEEQMTREELDNKASEIVHNSEDLDYDLIKDIRRFGYDIVNDFESRTCENCVCFKTPQYKSSFCEKINHVVPFDFGCNKFERKP